MPTVTWPMMAFSEAVEINPRRPLPKVGYVPFLDMARLPLNGAPVQVADKRPVGSGGARFRAGDTLFARITPCAENGKLGFVADVAGGPTAQGSTEFIVMGARDGLTLPEYVRCLSGWSFVRDHAIGLMEGTSGRQRIPAWAFDEIEVPVPPLDEQRRIAEVLRSVDEAIASADRALTQARMVRQTVVNELLSPTGGSAEMDRLGCRLSEVLSIAHGFPFKSEYFTSNRDDPILLTPGNFSVEKTLYFGDRTKHYSGPVPDGYVLEDGSLVVVMTDLTQDMAILGNAVEISGNAVVLHNQRIGRVSLLRPDLITKGYARLLLNSDLVQSRVKSTASGSTVRHTAPSRILECEVQLPPPDEQARIVAIAKSLDDIVIAEERRRSDDEVTGPLSHLRSMKDLIARDLLSGHVRVPA